MAENTPRLTGTEHGMPRRFLAVPTSALWVDPSVSAGSPKGYSERDLQEVVATVPAIYDRMADGWTEADFVSARASGDYRTRQLGDTYSRLFQDSPSSAPLAASYDGRDLVVDKGNHRIREAQKLGIPVLPVWVSAQTEAELDRVDGACARRAQREGTVPHRSAHASHVAARGHQPLIERERGRSFEGNLDRGSPEVWR